MHAWSETDLAVRDVVRQFIEAEIKPQIDDLETGATPPYEVIRSLWKQLGIDVMAEHAVGALLAERPANPEGTQPGEKKAAPEIPWDQAGALLAATAELSGVSMGTVAAIGGSLGLCAATIAGSGTVEQKRRWLPDLVTFRKVGAWGLTEPDAGSDAFGGMQTTVTRDGEDFILKGQKTFITNAPYADTIVVYAKLADPDVPKRQRLVLPFVLDKGMPGLVQGKPMHKMGIGSSPTGELFFDDVRLTPDRLLGGVERLNADGTPTVGKDSAKATFIIERVGVAVLALGVIERCLQTCVDYARTRESWGQRIGDYQLIQLKLAQMEIARVNVRNMIFQTMSQVQAGALPSLAESSAIKIYSSQAATEVANEAVQFLGGNGYMREYRMEQLARDSRSLMIYAGTNEIQVTHVARGLLDG